MRTGPRLLVLFAVLQAACVAHVHERCPRCEVVEREHPDLPRIKPGTHTLFVIVPGALGYGWEWDRAALALSHTAGVDFFVFFWDPWGSLRRAADELGRTLMRALWRSPPSVHRVVVVAHSAGGLVAAHALGDLQVPASRPLHVVTIGAPFAGMLALPFALDDPLSSPLMMAIIGSFRRYPDPPPSVTVTEYVTSYPKDPVMQSHFGHAVAPREIGPRGAERILVDPREDHNTMVSQIVLDLIARSAP